MFERTEHRARLIAIVRTTVVVVFKIICTIIASNEQPNKIQKHTY